jgi:hypothetical protein
MTELIKDDKYYLHQTPPLLAQKLIATLPLIIGDVVLEPFKGEGSFYDAIPDYCVKEWTELTEGRDYRSFSGKCDWVITNPPFMIYDDSGQKLKNAFFELLDYYTDRSGKGVAFLGCMTCYASLTPLRMKKLNDKGWYLKKTTMVNVKKWCGRYLFMVFTKERNESFDYVVGNF